MGPLTCFCADSEYLHTLLGFTNHLRPNFEHAQKSIETMFKNGPGSDWLCSFPNLGSGIERNSFYFCLNIFGVCSGFEPKFKNSSIHILYVHEYCS